MATPRQDAATHLLPASTQRRTVESCTDPDLDIRVAGFHSSYRVAPDGQLLIDIVAQFEQRKPETSDEFGGVPLRGGTTVVASADGVVRYVISKPFESGASTSIKSP